jgi:hypothetical protein
VGGGHAGQKRIGSVGRRGRSAEAIDTLGDNEEEERVGALECLELRLVALVLLHAEDAALHTHVGRLVALDANVVERLGDGHEDG